MIKELRRYYLLSFIHIPYFDIRDRFEDRWHRVGSWSDFQTCLALHKFWPKNSCGSLVPQKCLKSGIYITMGWFLNFGRLWCREVGHLSILVTHLPFSRSSSSLIDQYLINGYSYSKNNSKMNKYSIHICLGYNLYGLVPRPK